MSGSFFRLRLSLLGGRSLHFYIPNCTIDVLKLFAHHLISLCFPSLLIYKAFTLQAGVRFVKHEDPVGKHHMLKNVGIGFFLL